VDLLGSPDQSRRIAVEERGGDGVGWVAGQAFALGGWLLLRLHGTRPGM